MSETVTAYKVVRVLPYLMPYPYACPKCDRPVSAQDAKVKCPECGVLFAKADLDA